LAKLVYFTRELDTADNGGRLNFINFETHRIDICIDFIRQLKEEHEKRNGSTREGLCVVATGGGAFKFYDKLKEALDVNILREEEMECLIIGAFLSYPSDSAQCSQSHRSRFLHHRNPERGFHLQ
jgi:type II pantothenate kinase